MKVLPMQEPWASLVVLGAKTTETRDRHTNVRGTIAVLATKTVVPYTDAHEAWARLADLLDVPLTSVVSTGCGMIHRGSIIGVVGVVDSVATKDVVGSANLEGWRRQGSGILYVGREQMPLGDFGPGRRVWLLEHASTFDDPIPCRGMPGMFDAPPAIEPQLHERMGVRS